MASSLISNSHHVSFGSVFGMDDATITQMFELLIATGLKEFLGCPAVYYEAALIDFFENGSVREYGMVVSTIRGINVEISEGMFSTAFGLPTEGLTDVSDVPKDLVFDAKSLFSESEEQVSISFFKKEMKIEYRLLHDILAKTLFVKAGSFDAVTRERFMLMTAITFDVKINWGSMFFGVLKAMVTPGSRQAKGYAIQICAVLSKVPGLELGESNPFPIHRVLTERTVHRFIHINEQIGMEKASGSTPVKKTVKKHVSKKRPAASETEVAPIAMKNRTTKGKPAAMAVEAVPLQTIEPTTDVPAELPPVPKRKSRKRRLVLEQEDDLVVDEPVEESATGVQETVGKAVADPDPVSRRKSLISYSSEMASSLISNSHHVSFGSVFGMDDATITQMFELLIATGLKDFLGCPAVYYEAELIEFVQNGSVREDGMVVSTIKGINVEISEGMFSTAFGIPTEGLTDVSDVPKDLVFDAKSLFSESEEQVSISFFKKEMKIEYRLLHDILAKTLFVKAGSFDAVTRERFMLMTAITFDEGSSIDHQVTIYLYAQNITMFPTNETWYFAVRVDAQLANLWRVGFIDSCTNDLYICYSHSFIWHSLLSLCV
ncbi:hypothetical protein F511_28592 [Dorcoceras hygrometricum]|uniref:Dystroglycan-like n=1 Tax=Dorcoceras hygrometricum TaxID=472368 RepID=A0A2Z7C0B8_9LAMI|nr:hypothetical protein F511_28592 [Dorcoceras hygrometricum]